MSKTHVPVDGGVLCGSSKFGAIFTCRDMCTRCLGKIDKILSILTDEQLKALKLVRASEPEPQPKDAPT